jgi:hypothetical protein
MVKRSGVAKRNAPLKASLRSSNSLAHCPWLFPFTLALRLIMLSAHIPHIAR